MRKGTPKSPQFESPAPSQPADPYLEEEEDGHDKDLINHLATLVSSTKGGEQLTWAALYALKQQEIDFNEQMKAEIEAVKDKYQLMKQPIYRQISDVAIGNKVDDKLYKPTGLVTNAQPKKTVPQPIEDFWGIVFEKEGLITEEVDVDCFGKISEFNCQLVDQKTNDIRISFRFNKETDYFKNLYLSLNIRYEGDGPVRTLSEKMKYKTKKVENSIFTLLFDAETDLQACYNFASEVYQDYSNSLYFYFREEDEEENEGEEGGDEQGDDAEEEEELEEEIEEEIEEPKPNKKRKGDTGEKPQCKNQ